MKPPSRISPLCLRGRPALLASFGLLFLHHLHAANPPQGSDATRTILEDAAYAFALEDFGFGDPLDQPLDQFTSVRLASLPSAGVLLIDGTPASVGSNVALQPWPGRAWEPQETVRSWGSVACSNDGTTVVAGTLYGGVLHISRDRGATWSPSNPSGNGGTWHDLAVSSDGTRIVCAAGQDSLYVSTDAGLTWTPRGPSTGWLGVASSADGLRLAAVPLSGSIHVSSDGGSTWTPHGPSADWSDVASSVDGMRLVASQWNGPLAVSTDGGSTWAVRESARQWTAVTSSADGVKLAASVRNGQIWLSDDGGVNWRSAAQSRAWVDVVSSPDGKFLAAAAQEGLVYTSADRGQTWIARDSNRIWVALALSADSRELWACEYDGRLHRSGPQPATLVFQPAPEESGSPYASFSFQVADSGPEGFNLDPSPNVITFHVTPADDPPAVAIALPDQWAGIGRPFSFTIAPGIFADPDSGAPIAFSAVRADGGPLPPWLAFSPASQTFSGIPAVEDRRRTDIRVTATDLTGLSAIDTFALEVAGYPQGAGGSITLDEETSFTITAADFGFTDPFDNPPDSLARVRLTTVPALGTLRLNGNSVAARDFAPLVPTPGVTWTRRTTLANSRLVCSADAGRLLAVLTPAGGPSVYRSVNGGQTWLPLNFFGSHLARPTCAAASADGSRWVVAAQDRGRIHTSADYGQTWVAREAPRNWAALACSVDGSRILAVDRGDANGLAYISIDFGATWTWRPQTMNRWVAAASSADGMKLAIASRESSSGVFGVIMTSSDGGTTWSQRSPQGNWRWLASSGDGARLAAASSIGLFLSEDSGGTWRQALAEPNLTSVSSSIDGRTLAATAANGRIHVTIDRGATWAAAGETADWSCVVSASDGKNMVAAGSTGIFTSSPSTPSLVYTPPENGAGNPYTTLTYQVEDSGPPGLNLDSVPRTLSIHVTNVNDPPVAVEPLPAQIVPPSAALSYQISATAFSDPDPDDRLSFGTTLDDGQSLPFWLSFDASTRTVSAAAGAAVPGALRLRITASDQGAPPGQAQALLSLTFLSHPPAGSDTTITLKEDNDYRFTPADFRFSDPGDTPPNLFRRILLASIPATGTLTIDGITLGAGEYVSILPDARMAWSQHASRKAWQDIAMSTDGSRLVAVWGISGTEAPSGEITLSSDGGATWTPALPGKYWNCVAMTPDGTNVVAAARNDRLAISVNSGQSWTQRGPAEDWGSVAISEDGTRILAAPYYGTLNVSQNGGLTWTSKVYSMPWSKVAMSDDGSVMAAVGVGLWISLDSGATWTQRGGEGSWASVVLSSDGERVAAINGEQFLYSLDFGTSWETRGPAITWSRLAGSSDATRLVAADRFSGRLFVSSDSGHTWTPKERINNWTGLASSDDGSFLAAASSTGFIFTSVAAVPELVFKPAANAWGIPYAQFAFRAGDSGTPGSNLAETVASVTIDVVSVNDPPTVAIPISDRAATEYAAFNYTFSPSTFTDADAGTVLTYAAALATGAPLPAWLQFNPATRTFAGVPGSPDTGVLDIVVTASDSTTPPLSTTDTFQISVRNVDEPPSGSSATLTLAEDVPWVFTPAHFGFSDPADVPPNAFSRVKLTTLPTAGVLAVDGVPAVPGSFARLTPSSPAAIWSPRGTTASWWAVCSSDDGNRLAAVVNGARIHTSVDAGATWTARETNRNWYAIANSADGQRLAAIVMGGLIYTSQNAGATWVPRATPRAWRAIASSADGSRLTALDSPGQIHVSSDFGATWTPRESARAWYSIASSANGMKLAAVVQNGTIFTSDDAGATWVPRESSRNWRALTSSADGLKLAAVEQNGAIYTSADAGASWSARESARNWYSIASSADGTRLAAVVQSGRIYHSSDGGATWTARAANGFWRAIASSADGNRLVAVAPGDKIYTSAIEPAQSLAFIPAANAIGSPYASFTFQVVDDGPPNANLDASPDTVTFHVTESNDAPTLNPIADPPLMAAEAGAQTIALSGISAGGGESQALSVSAVSSNPALVPHPVVNYVSPDAMASMTYTPMQGAAGNVILTVIVRDTGGTANGGIDQSVRAFTVSLITPFQRWALQNGLPTDPAAVGGLNFFAYAFGLNSDGSERNPIAVAGGSIQRRGMPSLLQTGGAPAPQFSVIFGRRKDSGLDYQVQFSSDFSDWETSPVPPVPVAQDAVVEAFSVPFPARLASGRVPRFFRIKIIGP